MGCTLAVVGKKKQPAKTVSALYGGSKGFFKGIRSPEKSSEPSSYQEDAVPVLKQTQGPEVVCSEFSCHSIELYPDGLIFEGREYTITPASDQPGKHSECKWETRETQSTSYSIYRYVEYILPRALLGLS